MLGCNRATCSARREAWRVIRTQQTHDPKPRVHGVDQALPEPVSNRDLGTLSPPAREATGKGASHGWGGEGGAWGVKAGGDDWGCVTGDWGEATVTSDDVFGNTSSSVPAIDALLEKQDARSRERVSDALGATKKRPTRRRQGGGRKSRASSAKKNLSAGADEPQGANARSPSGGSGGRAQARTSSSFPCKALDFSTEPCQEKTWKGGEDEEMESRIRRYREQEEDRELVAALDRALASKEAGRSGGGGAEGSGDKFSGAAGEKYESTPAR